MNGQAALSYPVTTEVAGAGWLYAPNKGEKEEKIPTT